MTLDLETLVLRAGIHSSAVDGVSLMEAVSVVAGEPWSNSPRCTSPVIATYARGLNDWLSDIERQSLKAYIPRLIGTAKPNLELERAFICADVAVRVFARLALAAAGIGVETAKLGALAPVDRESSELARSAASVAELAARSAVSRSEWSLMESMRSARGVGPVGRPVGGVGGALSGGGVGVGGRVDSTFVSPVGGIGGGSGAAGREGGRAGPVGGASAPRSPHRGRLMTEAAGSDGCLGRRRPARGHSLRW